MSDVAEYEEMISAFCDSKAFREDPFTLLHALEKSLERLPGMTCMVCEKFLDYFPDWVRKRPADGVFRMHSVSSLIFRTYQQHQDDEWTSRSLDLIDRLCLEGVGERDSEFELFER